MKILSLPRIPLLPVVLMLGCTDSCGRVKDTETGGDTGDTADSQESDTADSADTDTAHTGDTDTAHTGDTDTAHTGETDTDHTGETDSGGETGGETGGGTGGETDDTSSDTSSPSDTGPGPDPDPGHAVAQPHWHRMWIANDLGGRLDGRGSYDPAGLAITYWWSATDGSFDDPTSSTPWYTGASGNVTLEVTTSDGTGDGVVIQVLADDPGAQVPSDYATVDDALLAGETLLYLEPGTYGAVSGAEGVVGDPDGGVIIDAAGSDIGVSNAQYLRHLTITGAAFHGVLAEATDLRLHDVVLESNGSDEANDTDHWGGGIWSDSTVVMIDTVIQYNDAYLGGGIYLERSASLYAQQSVLANNFAQYGGGIYTNTTTGNVSLWNCLIVSNEGDATGGGGVFLDSRAFFNRVTVADNINGGIKLRIGYFEIDDSVFAYNDRYGIQESDSPTVHLYDSAFHDADIVKGGTAPSSTDGNIVGTVVFTSFVSGDDWIDQDLTLDPTSIGYDFLPEQDRDGSAQDAGAYGGFLARFPSGTQGAW